MTSGLPSIVTGALSLPLEQTDPIGAALFLLLIAGGIAGYFYYRHLTALIVPPNTIVVILPHRNIHDLTKARRVLHAGERYHPHKKLEDDHAVSFSLLPQTHLVGRYAVTWKIANLDRFIQCPALVPQISEIPIPIRNLQILLAANPAIDFPAYAEQYGIEILKIDPPINSTQDDTVTIGYAGSNPLTVSYEDRKQHVYVTGKTKSGKSTLLVNMAVADIKRGKGVAFLDPHGDSARELLTFIPRERVNDVIFISGDYPQPLSIMESRSDTEQEILSDDIYTLLRGMSDTWGERMDAILTNTLRALFSAKHCSFLDIYHFLADPAIRQNILSRVDDETILRFWENYHPPNYPRGSEQPILSRMEKFITRPTLVKILGSKTGIDIYDVIQSGKILLVDTSRHSMGEHTGRVLGGLIVTKIYQATMRRAALPKSARTPFYLYIDEFQSYIATNIENFLSETRKYGTSLALAHQYLAQIPDAARHAIFGNVGTFVFFQLGHQDARHAQNELGRFSADDIVNLSIPLHEAIVRPAQGPAHATKITTLPPPKVGADYSEEILSRQPRPEPRQKPDPPDDDEDDILPSPFPSK